VRVRVHLDEIGSVISMNGNCICGFELLAVHSFDSTGEAMAIQA